MDVITQQMKSVALSGNANKSDANDFNEGLFKYLLFVAKNAGTKNIWSEADKDLKAWMRKLNKGFLRLTSDGHLCTILMRYSSHLFGSTEDLWC